MLMTLLLAAAFAAAPPDVAKPVHDYIDANATQSAEPLRRAFHPAASIYWVNDDGGIDARTMADWRQRIVAPEGRARWRQRIIGADRSGDAAVVAVTGTCDDAPVIDLLLLLRVDGHWRIVGKVFDHVPYPEHADAAGAAAIEAAVRAKFDGDRASDGARLLATQAERATFFNLDDGVLVPASAQEWAARYDQRRREDAVRRARAQRIDAAVAIGDIGYARWTTTTSSGREIVDYALLLRTASGWRFVNTAFVVAPAP